MFTRSLYSANVLGVDGFQASKERIRSQISDINKFKETMGEFAKSDSAKNLIFTEDLKNMLHIAESPQDIELLQLMITKFVTQSSDVRFGNFVFGPVVMRMFHGLKDADNALRFFKDEKMLGFFDQLASFQIILDLLFETQKYKELLETYDFIQARQVSGGKFPKHAIVLTFGACYKLNTPESYEYASKLWKKCIEVGHQPMRRAVSFFAALCINQDQPEAAIEVLSTVRQQNYVHIKVLKALALAKIKRYDDVMVIVKSIIEFSNPMMDKQTFPKEFMDQLKVQFKDSGHQVEFGKCYGFMESNGHISNQTISDMLTSEIRVTAQSADRDSRDGRFQNQYKSYDGPRGPFNKRLVDQRLRRNELDEPSTGRVRRPGLHELN